MATGRTGAAYLAGLVGRLPVGVIARAQPGVSPDDAALRATYGARDSAKEWRGDGEAESALRIAGAGMLSRVQGAEGEDAYPNDIYLDPFAWPAQPQRIYTAFFLCDIKDFHRYGEDAYFSRRMKECGVKLWIDPNITITHYGIHGWTGNLHESLLKPQEELARIAKQQQDIADSVCVAGTAAVN